MKQDSVLLFLLIAVIGGLYYYGFLDPFLTPGQVAQTHLLYFYGLFLVLFGKCIGLFPITSKRIGAAVAKTRTKFTGVRPQPKKTAGKKVVRAVAVKPTAVKKTPARTVNKRPAGGVRCRPRAPPRNTFWYYWWWVQWGEFDDTEQTEKQGDPWEGVFDDADDNLTDMFGGGDDGNSWLDDHASYDDTASGGFDFGDIFSGDGGDAGGGGGFSNDVGGGDYGSYGGYDDGSAAFTDFGGGDFGGGGFFGGGMDMGFQMPTYQEPSYQMPSYQPDYFQPAFQQPMFQPDFGGFNNFGGGDFGW